MPIDITNGDASSFEVGLQKKLFLSIRRSGGTGFFWDPSIEDPNIATIEFVKSVTDTKTQPTQVGVPETDLFMLKGLRTGQTAISFGLKRAKTAPIQSLKFILRVLEK